MMSGDYLVPNDLGDKDVIGLNSMRIRLIFFDSLGAKCSSVLVETPDVSILIDPGAAGLQPGFPLPSEDKALLRERAFERILHYGVSSDVVVITHYHYDHHIHPSRLEGMIDIFRDKTLLIKDPNQWINGSQRLRALKFLSGIYELLGGEGSVKDLMEDSKFRMSSDPFNDHPRTSALWLEAEGKKRMVLEAKKRWFSRIVEAWRVKKWIRPFQTDHVKVVFADGREFRFGDTIIRFSNPLFHGQFLDNVGWVIGLMIEHGKDRFLFTSDLQGPIIEEYAEWIVDSKPDVIVADGPPLYTYGFMIGREDVEWAAKNMRLIIRDARPTEIIWDHHMCRGLFRDRLGDVYECAERMSVKLCTAAEHIGRKPLIEHVASYK